MRRPRRRQLSSLSRPSEPFYRAYECLTNCLVKRADSREGGEELRRDLARSSSLRKLSLASRGAQVLESKAHDSSQG